MRRASLAIAVCGRVLSAAAVFLPLAGCNGAGGRWFRWGAPADPPAKAAADEPPAVAHPAVPTTQKLAAAPVGSVSAGVLRINNETISVADVLEPIRGRLERAAKELPQREYYEEMIDLVRRSIVEEVSERLIWHAAQRELKDDELKKRLDAAVDEVERRRINDEFAGRESRYEKHLAELHLERATVRERIKRRLVVEQYLKDRLLPLVSVRKPDLLAYYEQHRGEFTAQKRIELLTIEAPFRAFVDAPGPATEAEKSAAMSAARRHMETALARLRGGASFDAVAREFSRGVQRERGGSWGMISAPLRGPYARPSEVAFGMNAGQTSDILETPAGLFIVKVGRVEGGQTESFETLQPRIAERLRVAQFNELRTRFLQKTLEQASLGDLEPFVRAVVARAPESSHRGPGATGSRNGGAGETDRGF